MSKKKAIVTNAMRLLNTAGISYEAIEYEPTADMLSDNAFGMHISELTGIPMEQSFKTLVAKGDKTGILVCCIPVNRELDLKKLAKVSGDKKTELIHVRELLALTGYIRGGVSPIGMKKKYPTFIDSSCVNFAKVAVSGGVCGSTIQLSPHDLLKITDASPSDITV